MSNLNEIIVLTIYYILSSNCSSDTKTDEIRVIFPHFYTTRDLKKWKLVEKQKTPKDLVHGLLFLQCPSPDM